jgi:hypothetical protein
MRRADREITSRERIDEIIRGCEVCHLGMADGDQPYVVPVSFGYDGSSVYFHSAREGRKVDVIAANPRVCVQFERRVVLMPSETEACEWSFAFESAIGVGYEAARHRLLERTVSAMQPFVAQLEREQRRSSAAA